MGLIMLILIGTVPTVYALNHAVDTTHTPAFIQTSRQIDAVFARYAGSKAEPGDSRAVVAAYVHSHSLKPDTVAAVRALSRDIAQSVADYGSVAQIPGESMSNVRNDMYLVNEALRSMDRQGAPSFTLEDRNTLLAYKATLDRATKFIPTWVKVAIACALGLGTMIG
jgi:PiT family inorganic phosphate transporter